MASRRAMVYNARAMIVRLLARPQFLGLPAELGSPRGDQLLGPDSQQLIETAGRTCYDSFGKGRNSAEYAAHILQSQHGSVLEHAQFAFFISGVSRGLTHELVRHRVGVAISQRSTRYVDEHESDWVMHPVLASYIQRNPGSKVREAWFGAVRAGRLAYAAISRELEEELLRQGLDPSTARKQARGAARGALGNALTTELVWSANVRALRHIIQLRGALAADQEIRTLARELLAIMQTELPVYFSDLSVQI